MKGQVWKQQRAFAPRESWQLLAAAVRPGIPVLGLNPHWVPQRTTGGDEEFWVFAVTAVGIHGQIPAHLTGQTQVILVASTLQLVSHGLFLDSFRLSDAGNGAGNTTAMVQGAEPSLQAIPWASNLLPVRKSTQIQMDY